MKSARGINGEKSNPGTGGRARSCSQKSLSPSRKSLELSTSRRSQQKSVSPTRKPDTTQHLATPQSFQKAIDSLGALGNTYSDYRRQANRERSQYHRNLKEVHRENSCDLAALAERTSPRVEDRLSDETMQAVDAWEKFSKAMKRADSEDLDKHRQHLTSIVHKASPRVVDKLSAATEQVRSRFVQEREVEQRHEAAIRQEYERGLEKLMRTARPRIEDDLSDVTKDVRQRLSELRTRMRTHDADVFALQQRALLEMRDSTGVRVDAKLSSQVSQLRHFFDLRKEEQSETRRQAMNDYFQEIQEMLETSSPAVDCYIDNEVKSSRRLPLDDEKEQIAKLQKELTGWQAGKVAKEKAVVQRLQSQPWWVNGESGEKFVRGGRDSGRAAQLDGTSPRSNGRNGVRRHFSASPLRSAAEVETSGYPRLALKKDMSFTEGAGTATTTTPTAMSGTTPTSIMSGSYGGSYGFGEDSPMSVRTQQMQSPRGKTPKAGEARRLDFNTPPSSVNLGSTTAEWRSGFNSFTPTPRTPQSARTQQMTQMPGTASYQPHPVAAPAAKASSPSVMHQPSLSYSPMGQGQVASDARPFPSRGSVGPVGDQVQMARRRGGMNSVYPQQSSPMSVCGPQYPGRQPVMNGPARGQSPGVQAWPQATQLVGGQLRSRQF